MSAEALKPLFDHRIPARRDDPCHGGFLEWYRLAVLLLYRACVPASGESGGVCRISVDCPSLPKPACLQKTAMRLLLGGGPVVAGFEFKVSADLLGEYVIRIILLLPGCRTCRYHASLGPIDCIFGSRPFLATNDSRAACSLFLWRGDVPVYRLMSSSTYFVASCRHCWVYRPRGAGAAGVLCQLAACSFRCSPAAPIHPT